MYRSGDLGRLCVNGELEYIGRADEQIKIRGFRVELGDVSARLSAHPALAQTVVHARNDDGAGVQLVAYFSMLDSTQTSPSPQELRAYLRNYLPGYMFPVAYVRIDDFTLTINGKIDRAVLPPPGPANFSTQAYEAPQGDTEKWLAQVWSGLLCIDPVSYTHLTLPTIYSV